MDHVDDDDVLGCVAGDGDGNDDDDYDIIRKLFCCMNGFGFVVVHIILLCLVVLDYILRHIDRHK